MTPRYGQSPLSFTSVPRTSIAPASRSKSYGLHAVQTPFEVLASTTPSTVKKESMGAMNAYGRYAGLGFQFVASMCILGYGGYWLDGKLGTYPLLLIVGIFLGAAGGFYSLLQAVPSTAAPKRQTPPGEGSDDT